MELLDSRKGLPGQQLVTKKGDDTLPTCYQAPTSTLPRGSTTLPGSVACPEGPPWPCGPPSRAAA